MCKRLVCLLSVCLILGLAGSASADLVLHWALDDGAGTVASDSSGNGRDGEIGGTPNWVEGVIRGALDLDGSSNYIDYNEEIVTGTCSVALWLMPRDMPYTTGYRSIFHVEQWNAGSVHGHLRANTSLFNFDINGGGAVTSTTEGVSDEWYHLAGTFDLETDTSRIYVNGVMEAEGSGISGSLYMGPLNFGAWTDNQRFFPGVMDDIRIYDHALAEEDIPIVMLGDAAPELAGDPIPDTETTDIPRDVTLAWTPGEFAVTHDVYLGMAFNDVNDADRGNPMAVLVSQGQSDATYTPDAVLTFGETYYWRVDEVNGAPDNTIFKGEVWSFTVEPFAYAIENVVATSNGTSDAGVGPERTVDGSGLNENDEHSAVAADMWLAVPGAEPLQVQYEFDAVYKLHEMLVWNYNVQFELMLGFGLKDVTVEYSENGTDWTVLGDVQLAQATAKADYAANTTIAFGGVAAKSVRMTVNSGYGPMGQFGLSEVRFLFIPAQAREPQPADGADGVDVGVTLSWRAGREAVTHEVYLGTDPDALALVDSVSEASYAPSDLQFGTMYHWQIVEVNEAEAISSWAGNVWNFTAQEFAVIDDMESYDDEDNRIYDGWLDGFVNGTGSTVGYFEAPFAEKTIVNSGSQSMPLEYDNSVAPFYSEAELELDSANWATNGADTLRLFVSGQAPGFFETADGSILMNGIGTDIWGNNDEFRFAYKQLTGNGSLVALVEDLDESPNTWVKAGVMIRQSTDIGSVHSFMPMTGGGGNGASWQGRPTENAASANNDATDPVAPPYWVRIDRAGDSLTGSISPDGQTWTQIGDARSIAMTDPVLIGLALTSHNTAQATSAEFSNVGFTGNVTGDWQIAEVGIAQPEGNSPESLYVAVEDTSGNVAVVTSSDAAATGRPGWTEWLIPYGELTGVNLGRVAILRIGVGDRDNPSAGGTGLVFIDDIGFGSPAPAVE